MWNSLIQFLIIPSITLTSHPLTHKFLPFPLQGRTTGLENVGHLRGSSSEKDNGIHRLDTRHGDLPEGGQSLCIRHRPLHRADWSGSLEALLYFYDFAIDGSQCIVLQ